MQTNVMTSNKSSGCGCAGTTSKGGSCGCGGKGCSVCESLPEAYSRPQFFSGQLLTEDDLQSLADYTVAKNRLHNRMLFGEGVACGLRVTVDVCEPERHLVVRPGYAIDCCGNDIVVPCEARLDVVQLVRDLRTRMLGKDCGDPCRELDEYDCPERKTPAEPDPPPPPAVHGLQPAAPANSGGAVAKKGNSYCLYVVYCEQPADPVAPYDGADSCGGGECQHTRVREGYRFELRCGTPSGCEPRKPIKPNSGFYSSLTGRAVPVYDRLVEANNAMTGEARAAALIAVQNMVEVGGAHQPGNFNLLIAKASRLPLDQAGQRDFNSIVTRLLVGALRNADCDSMLPDCPPCDEDGVLIACFDFEDCKVTNLCVARRLQILSPAYFSQIGFTHAWRCLLNAHCCKPENYNLVTGRPLGFGRNARASIATEAPTLAAAGAPMEGAAAAATTDQAAAEENMIEDLGEYLKARLARIDDASVPESRFTLLPELVKDFGASITRTPLEGEVRDEELYKQLADLRGQLDELKEVVASIGKGTGRKGGKQ